MIQMATEPRSRLAMAMHRPRGFDLFAVLGLFCGAALCAPPAHADAYVSSIAQVCEQGGLCATAPTSFGPGQRSDISRGTNFTNFQYSASSAVITDFVGFSAFARASGFESPEITETTPPVFGYEISRSARAFGEWSDTITAGTGGGEGFLRIRLRLTGHGAISWQNGYGSARFSFGGFSVEPERPFDVIGNVDPVGRAMTVSEVIDQVANLDIPILLGSPIRYTVTAFAGADTGHYSNDAIPFSGQSEIGITARPFAGAIVLDASKQPIPGATVSVGESGFDYAVPEASSLPGALAALASLEALRRRRRA